MLGLPRVSPNPAMTLDESKRFLLLEYPWMSSPEGFFDGNMDYFPQILCRTWHNILFGAILVIAQAVRLDMWFSAATRCTFSTSLQVWPMSLVVCKMPE